MALTLEDIQNAPSDPVALNQHLQMRGLIPLPPPPVQGLPPATVGRLSPVTPPTSVAPMTPPVLPNATVGVHTPEPIAPAKATVTPMSPLGASMAIGATAQPTVKPLSPVNVGAAPDLGSGPPATPTADLGIKPMTPPTAPTKKESIEAGKEEYKANRPQVTAPPNSAEFWQQKIAQDEYDKAHPWGNDVSAHPGLLGKIGHIAGLIGQTAGAIVAPGAVAQIPGTRLNRSLKEQGEEAHEAAAEGRENTQKNTESEIALRGAQQKEAEQRTGKEATEQSLEKDAQGNPVGWKGPDGKLHSLDEEGTPQAIKDIAEASKSKQGPQLEKTANGDIVQVTTDKDGKAHSEVVYHGDPKVETDVVQRTINGQEHHVLVDKNKGTDIKDLGAFKTEPSPAAAEKAEQAGEKWVTGEDENGKNVMVPRSQAKELGLKNIAEANADDVNKTKSARHVLPLLFNNDPKDPGVLQMIDDLDKKGKLGPLASRWNDFMARKFGADDPDYSALRARMDLATTKLMQAHVGSRGGSFMLEHFENIANAKKMGAADLRAGVDQELRYIYDISQLPSKKSAGGGGAAKPPAVGDIVGGYKFNGGEPSDKKNWTKQ